MQRSYKFKPILILFITLVACSSSPPVVERLEDGVDGDPVMIYVAGHGWHTAIIVSATDMLARFPALKTRFSDDNHYLEFGWGDKDFYQAEEPGIGLAGKAVLWPTKAVMHVVAVTGDVSGFFPNSEIHPLCLSQNHYAALLDFIAGSFRRTKTGAALPLEEGLYGDSWFYEAQGNYSLLNTCNTWTAKGLKSAGFDINPAFKARASSVMNLLRKVNSCYDSHQSK